MAHQAECVGDDELFGGDYEGSDGRMEYALYTASDGSGSTCSTGVMQDRGLNTVCMNLWVWFSTRHTSIDSIFLHAMRCQALQVP